MNEEPLITKTGHKPRHGSYGSYISGFVLSLLFTLIPYYLVVHKTFTGGFLIGIILLFAFSQLLIQVLFFLHLGRERGPRFNTVFLMSTIGAVTVVVAGSVWIMYHLQSNMPTMETTMKIADDEGISEVGGFKTGGCQGTNTNHHVFIIHGSALPNHITAHVCDTLTITNEDNATRNIAFGNHLQNDTYAGEIGQTIYHLRSWTLTLSQTGTYQFHDHNHPNLNGYFTVNN